ncbi:MAG: amino acid adenylation domain-containing protein, partial [Gammaproteobacteria bacterium]
KARANQVAIKAEQGVLSGEVGLLPIQEWFFANDFIKANHWNQSFIIKVPALDMDRLKLSIDSLIFQHDAFRLRYRKQELDKKYIQFYDNTAPVEKLKILNIDSLNAKEENSTFADELGAILTTWQSNFNLEKGPLYSIGYINGYADGSARIYFALHHLLIDVVSWRILADDLYTLYHGGKLQAKGSSYRQWTQMIQNYKNIYADEQHYWAQVMSDHILTKIKFDNLLLDENSKTLANLSLTQDETAQLLHYSNQVYHTQINDLLLTALAISLSQLTPLKHQTIVNHIVLEGHGREEIADDLDITRTVGWFTTQYPVRLQLDNPEDVRNSIKQIKEILRTIPNKGIGYGALIGYHNSELPRICFNYLGQLDKEQDKNNNNNKENSLVNKEMSSQLWSMLGEPSGTSIAPENQDYNILSINGFVANGVLNFNIVSKLGEVETEKFADNFSINLKNIISHTLTQNRSFLTVSDINKIIDADYLSKLQYDKEVSGIYLANSLQQGFIYHELNQGDIDDAYRVQVILQYQTKINVTYLKQAWDYAQNKYPCLRLRLAFEDELVQVIDKVGQLDWRYIDLSEEKNLTSQELQIKQLQEQDRRERYNLNAGNLFRVYLIKQNNELYTCIFSSHHAILDGWSNPLLLNYVHDCYIKLANNVLQLIDQNIDYSYEIAQQYLQKHKNDYDEYWFNYLSNLDDSGDLNGLVKPDLKNIKIKEYKHILNPQEKNLVLKGKDYFALKNLCEEHGVTLNAILQYAWHKVLSIYGNTKQTVVGVTVSGRNIPIDNIENSVGLYINTLPLILDHNNSKQSIIEIIQAIQINLNEINDKSNINLAKLQRGGRRLFDSLFVYENYPTIADNNIITNLKIKFQGGVEKLDYPIALIAYEKDKKLIFKLKYAGELFSDEAVDELLAIVKQLIEQIINNPNQKCEKLTYLNKVSYQKIIANLNKNEAKNPNDKTIQYLFQKQVAKTPNSIALVFEKNNITYKELNAKANRLANYIRKEYNIQPDDLIALCLNRSEYMLIAILAVLKAGGAYVPLEPGYPNERIDFILADTQAKLILVDEINHTRFAIKNRLSTRPVIAIDNKIIQNILAEQLESNPRNETTCHKLAYVIYTSGTTGQPKGVMIEHSSVINTIFSLYDVYNFELGNKVTAFTSYVFDVSVSEFFIPLFKGGELHLFSETIKTDPDAISCYLIKNKINYVYLPPILLANLPKVTYNHLMGIVYAGEPCDKGTGKYWSNKYKLYNYYGPTEASIYAVGKQVLDGDVELIGKPIDNVTAYVLDDNLCPLPFGAIGELYIGGLGLARGYLNQGKLTEERFIVNPLQSVLEKKLDKNARLYKTGDLVRLLPEGNLQYIGRNDFQVKIRGYRIELAEIETTLCNFSGIRQSVVIVYENFDDEKNLIGNKYLVGYYTSSYKLDENAILSYLGQHLPDYMLPNILIHLEHLPLTINGKLDHKALPKPTFSDNDNYVPPRNELEEKVCHIYAKTLGLTAEQLSITDDFFRFGGDSILSIQLVSRLRQNLDINVSVKDIFLYKNVKQLFDNVITKLIKNEEIVIKTEQGILSGNMAFLPIQEWFFEQKWSKAEHWNQSFMVRVPQLDIEQLTHSLKKLVDYHDAFRLRYKQTAGTDKYVQYYDETAQFEQLRALNIKTLKYAENNINFINELDEILTSWQNQFNFEHGPLYSIGYIDGYRDGSSIIYFAFLHLIIDKLRWR